jgi:hypothetical protein
MVDRKRLSKSTSLPKILVSGVNANKGRFGKYSERVNRLRKNSDKEESEQPAIEAVGRRASS